MYEEFYGFQDKPFALTPNPRFVFYTQQYREAESQLLYGISNREGFMLVTGRPGCGKTTLCRDLIDKLDRGKVHSALVFNPFLNASEMLEALLTDFGLAVPRGASRKDLLDRLNQFLLAQLTLGKSCVAIFDEAQHLSIELLEQIRVLSNLETDSEKLLQIILVGQPELLDLLRSPAMAQLDQRVSIRCTVRDLDQQETDRYIHHRLNIAGARGQVRFTPAAVRTVFAESHGVPRLINLICDRALLAGYAQQTRDIGTAQVKKAAVALRGTEAELGVRNASGRGRVVVFALGLAVVGLAGFIIWRQVDAGRVTDASLYTRAARAANPAEAAKLYRELTLQFPQSEFVPPAYLALAEYQMHTSDDSDALTSFRLAMPGLKAGPVRTRAIDEAAVVELRSGDTLTVCRALASADSSVLKDPVIGSLEASIGSVCVGAQPTPPAPVDTAATPRPRGRGLPRTPTGGL